MCEGMILFFLCKVVRALVTLLALTNRILVVCYVFFCWKSIFFAFFRTLYVMFDTGIFFGMCLLFI